MCVYVYTTEYVSVISHTFVPPCPPYFQSTPCQPSQKHEASFAADGLIIAETLLALWPRYGGGMSDLHAVYFVSQTGLSSPLFTGARNVSGTGEAPNIGKDFAHFQ